MHVYTLCDQCRILHFDTRSPETQTSAHSLTGRTSTQEASASGTYEYILHRTRESLAASLAEGCHLCSLIRAQLDNHEFGDSYVFGGSEGKYIALKLNVSVNPSNPSRFDASMSYTSSYTSSSYNIPLPPHLEKIRAPMVINLSIFGKLGFGFLSNSYIVQEYIPPICKFTLAPTNPTRIHSERERKKRRKK